MTGERDLGGEMRKYFQFEEPPYGVEEYTRINTTWSSNLEKLHVDFASGKMKRLAYLQGVLDSVGEWGLALSNAVDGGTLHPIYLGHWLSHAKEFERQWNSVKQACGRTLKSRGNKGNIKWRNRKT